MRYSALIHSALALACVLAFAVAYSSAQATRPAGPRGGRGGRPIVLGPDD